MKTLALITALTVGGTTAALAQPAVRVEVREPIVYVRERDHYDRYQDSHIHRDFRGRWTPLARAYSAQSERQFIHVNNGALRKLRVEAVRGRPVIEKVVIEFADRTTQAVEINSTLDNGQGEVIDLNGGTRRVNRVIVYTNPRARGSYSVYGA